MSHLHLNAGLPEASGVHRLFFALWPDDATRGRIATAAAALRPLHPGGRWTAADRYHLTLQFLGTHRQLPASLVDAAYAAAAHVHTTGFSISLDHVGSFRTHSHLWWLGCRTAEPLLPLWSGLTQALAALDVPLQAASFVPHITVLRGASGPPPADAAVPSVAWPVTDLALVHSQSGAGGAYRVLRRWPLQTP